MKQTRYWQITINNPSDSEYPDPQKIKDLRYVIWQKEKGEQEETPHFHAHFEFKRSIRFTTIKKLFPRAHIESVRDREESMRYCCKVDTRIDGPFEWGTYEKGGQGRRNDIVKLYESVKSGKSNKEILEESPAAYMRYYRAVSHVRSVIAEPRNFKTNVIVVYGKEGLYKTTYCKDKTNNDYYIKPRGQWWDNYDGIKDVIIDDFYGWIKFDEMLRLGDENSMQVEIKGGYVNFASKNIYITSNKLPILWWKDNVYWPAFCRRVTEWLFFYEPGKYLLSKTWDNFNELIQMYEEGNINKFIC